MRLVSHNHTLLTNAEVLEHLNSVKHTSKSENLQTIIVELQAYLRERPAGNPAQPQTTAGISQFVAAIKREALTLQDAEILQIVNSAPSSLPVLFCLVEEADMRFSEQQLNRILELSHSYLGAEPMHEQ